MKPPSVATDSEEIATEELTLATIRCLAADLVQAYGGGHGGTPMGAAAIGVSLFRDVMRFNPRNPLWFNRDRFILTSKAAGHPEIEQEIGIEVTTGPLGQGIANSVGMAISAKQLAATYNKPGHDLFSSTIWCFTGDGCLQEGIGQEAISVAGHLALDSLVLIYDCNSITVDGTISSCFTEDIPMRFKAAGWNVIHAGRPETLATAALEIGFITTALESALGFGSRKANTGPAHGQALGVDEVAYVKSQFGMDPTQKFIIPPSVSRSFAHVSTKGAAAESEWNARKEAYAKAFPDEFAEWTRRISGELPEGWRDLLPTKENLPQAPQPTRKSSGIVVEALASRFPDFVAGSADLLESTFVSWNGMKEFQKPSSGLGDYTGRQIRYGIREHSMAAIASGLTAFWPQSAAGTSGLIPVVSTFFMFTLYMAPALRMAALQQLRTITVATHDSIGIGEDGPTHQPIALAAFFRALPGIRLFRPADAEETMGAWEEAIAGGVGPSVLCLSRQAVPLLAGTSRSKVSLGAYVVLNHPSGKDPDLTLIATGSEVSLAVDVAARLSSAPHSLAVRVVSMPSPSLFDAQPAPYRQSILRPQTSCLVVAIEAWSSYGWAKSLLLLG
ncbi:hypothetical protein RQP46_002336 [Phenoliferia psychrophenolica]